MLIRLIPVASQPTVLFKLVFENLPDTLQTPQAWINHLTALDCDDLETPELVHALDKAVGVLSILDQVTFDLPEQKMRCVFFDGEVEEWNLLEAGGKDILDDSAQARKAELLRRLDSVIDDVNESAAEMDRERKREEEKRALERLKDQEAEGKPEPGISEEPLRLTTSNLPDHRGKRTHKKHRSLLMNLVSSLIPFSLNSPRTPRSLPTTSPSTPRSSSPCSIRSFSPEKKSVCSSAPSTLSRSATMPSSSKRPRPLSSPSLPLSCMTDDSGFSPSIVQDPPPVIVAPPPPPTLSPRALRRRARSTLVDAFRLYALPEINRRVRSMSSAYVATSPVFSSSALYGSEVSAPYYCWIVGSTMKRVDYRLSEIGKELKDEMEAIGVEINLGALGGLGLGSLTSPSESSVPTTQTVDSPLHSLFGDGAHDTRDATDLESNETDRESEATLIDSPVSASWMSYTADEGNGSAVHHHQPKPTSPEVPVLGAMALSPSRYLASSLCSEPDTPALTVQPEVQLPESLNDLLIQHNELSTLHLRLAHLLLSAHARVAAAAQDTVQRENMLEVRGRRRAWLNRAFKTQDSSPERTQSDSKASVPTWGGGMASPFRPSGLGKYSFNSEDWDCDPFYYLDAPCLTSLSPLSPKREALMNDFYPNPFEPESDSSYAAHAYAHRRRRSASETSVHLFPVCEEESDDSSEDEEGCQRARLGAIRRLPTVEIDDDTTDEDDDDTDVDLLADLDLESTESSEDAVPHKPRLSLQIDPVHTASLSNSTSPTSLSMRAEAKITRAPLDVDIPISDTIDGAGEDLGNLALVAAANLSKRMLGDSKTDTPREDSTISRKEAWSAAVASPSSE